MEILLRIPSIQLLTDGGGEGGHFQLFSLGHSLWQTSQPLPLSPAGVILFSLTFPPQNQKTPENPGTFGPGQFTSFGASAPKFWPTSLPVRGVGGVPGPKPVNHFAKKNISTATTQSATLKQLYESKTLFLLSYTPMWTGWRWSRRGARLEGQEDVEEREERDINCN